MTSIEYISLENLLAELNVPDEITLRKLLKRNNLPSVSAKKPVARKVAEEIVLRLSGRKIDWYKYKLLEKEKNFGLPLSRNEDLYAKKQVQSWFNQINVNTNGNYQDDINRALGLVCTGGFLSGENGEEFLISFDNDCNLIIGDRGSGKSTLLNVFGLISDSLGGETQELVKTLLDRLNVNRVDDSDKELFELLKRTTKTLNFYDIRKYAYFFYCKSFYCYYADLETRSYDFFILDRTEWNPVEFENIPKQSVLFFQQGEVIKIAEDRDQNYYLNFILDAMFPNLYEIRRNIQNSTLRLVTQYEYFELKKDAVRSPMIGKFISERLADLKFAYDDARHGHSPLRFLEKINSYLNAANEYVNGMGKNLKEISIFKALSSRDENAFYYLLVGRISHFLGKYADQIQNGTLNLIAKEELFSLSDEFDDEISTMDDIEADDVAKGNIDESEEDQAAGLQELDESSRIEEILGGESFNGEKDISRTVVLELLALVNSRLRVLMEWNRLYKKNRVVYTDAIDSIVTALIEILERRIEIIREQEKICQNVTLTLNQDDMQMRIYTLGAETEIKSCLTRIQNLQALKTNYSKFVSATPYSNKLKDLRTAVTTYDETMRNLMETLKVLRTGNDNERRGFYYIPIGIDLLQGKNYRNFHQLSFGQKSGIILKMVLTLTDKQIILIDQPEDNLDANSIINMLTPTIKHLQKRKQIVLVTHNSNLVMGLEDSQLIVLESWGDHSRLKSKGRALDHTQVREMMEVLEGGVTVFERKVDIYEEFVNRVRGFIQDINIITIESSFRRRTIDGLRNYLQPIVSDRSILDILRHELKQRDIANIRKDIQEIILASQALGEPTSGLFEVRQMIDKLTTNLDNHIVRFQSAIEEIRLMDTQPKKEKVDLYNLLVEMREEYENKFDGKRSIRIDVDGKLVEINVLADRNHLNLIFRNLINNSLRATEKKIATQWVLGEKENMEEWISIELLEKSSQVVLVYKDNGYGIPNEIRNKLYKERCSDQRGKDHGLGGVIIAKLLDLNNGNIQVQSSQMGKDAGTVQQIVLLPEEQE